MFLEGKPAAYVATDFWYDRDEVWVQPVWIPVTAWDPQRPFAHVIPKSNWIFSVGPGSAFYSPYWRFEFVEVPEDTQPNQLRSAADVLNASKGIHDGALWIFSLLPLDVRVSAPAGADPVRPLNGDALMPVKLRQGWVEGQLWGVFDYGLDLFTTHGADVVDETPIYRFVTALPDGGEDPIDVPEVGGVGAPYSGAGPKLQDGAPTFGGLWRLYDVALPSSAAVFVPPSLPEMRQRLTAQGAVQVPELPDAVGSDPRAGDYALRVAVDGACFDGGFPDGCTWLDSQAALEAAIPEASILATDVTTTCPILEYLGQPVPSP
jgi:hypothetical protein